MNTRNLISTLLAVFIVLSALMPALADDEGAQAYAPTTLSAYAGYNSDYIWSLGGHSSEGSSRAGAAITAPLNRQGSVWLQARFDAMYGDGPFGKENDVTLAFWGNLPKGQVVGGAVLWYDLAPTGSSRVGDMVEVALFYKCPFESSVGTLVAEVGTRVFYVVDFPVSGTDGVVPYVGVSGAWPVSSRLTGSWNQLVGYDSGVYLADRGLMALGDGKMTYQLSDSDQLYLNCRFWAPLSGIDDRVSKAEIGIGYEHAFTF